MDFAMITTLTVTPISRFFTSKHSSTNPFYNNHNLQQQQQQQNVEIRCMSERSKNRKPLQRGRNLSSEAIQTVQALKRASTKGSEVDVKQVFECKVIRLLKLDMVAVLRELVRQNHPLLAFQVFQVIQKEYWYKPQLLLYGDMIKMFASNNMFEKVELLLFYLKIENHHLDTDTEGFNNLFRTLITFGFTARAVECFQFMKEVQCDPNESTFRILVNGLELKGEIDLSSMLKKEAEKYFGWPLECFEEDEEMNLSCN